MPIRPALFAAILAASPAAADMIEVTIANAPAGAQLCALVMQAPGEASAARAMIEAQRPVFTGGMASIEPPRDTTGRALYFEGRVRLVATAPGHCPVGCDLDIYWSHPPDPGTALAEQACAFDLSLMRTAPNTAPLRARLRSRLPVSTVRSNTTSAIPSAAP